MERIKIDDVWYIKDDNQNDNYEDFIKDCVVYCEVYDMHCQDIYIRCECYNNHFNINIKNHKTNTDEWFTGKNFLMKLHLNDKTYWDYLGEIDNKSKVSVEYFLRFLKEKKWI